MEILNFEACLSLIESRVSKGIFSGEPARLYDPASYIMSLGGKRIRPVFCLMGAQMFGRKAEQVLDLALAMEVFHNFSLVHDDIMDEAPLRRGRSTVHKKWDVSTALLSGDMMLIEAYDLISKGAGVALPTILDCFNLMAREVCEGQMRDMILEKEAVVSSLAYLEMIRQKTGALLGASLEIGALSGNAPERESVKLKQVGELAGLGFQVMDDYLDLFGDPEKTGKQTGGDVIQKKKTLLFLAALEKTSGSEKENLKRTYLGNRDPGEKVENIRKQFRALGIDAQVRSQSQLFFGKALELLEDVMAPENGKKPIRDLLHQIMNREF